MKSRRHGSKPTLALWMLVAVADMAVLAVAAGPVVVLVTLASLATVVAGVRAVRPWQRRGTPPTLHRRDAERATYGGRAASRMT
jgi:hypothetical protein